MKNKKISSKMKELWKDPIWREKTLASRRGLKRSNETKEKMRIAALKRSQNPEYIQKLKDNHWSTKNSQKDRCVEISRQQMLKNNPMKDPKVVNKQSKTLINTNRIRFKNSTTRWRLDILKRDNYCCQECGITNLLSKQIFGCRNNVHHIDFNKKNNKLNNGITLCQHCHSLTTKSKRNFWIGYYTAKIKYILSNKEQQNG